VLFVRNFYDFEKFPQNLFPKEHLNSCISTFSLYSQNETEQSEHDAENKVDNQNIDTARMHRHAWIRTNCYARLPQAIILGLG
jgi:hypothetical protein